MRNDLNLPVQVIDGVHVFDCRLAEELPWPKAPWGETLFGSERAAYSTGIRLGYGGNDVTPMSLSGCGDLRKWPKEFERVTADMVKAFKRFEAEYENALAHPANPDDGGSVFYKPAFVAICNYGGAVVADRRNRAVQAFGQYLRTA